jgi:hypothetical protein
MTSKTLTFNARSFFRTLDAVQRFTSNKVPCLDQVHVEIVDDTAILVATDRFALLAGHVTRPGDPDAEDFAAAYPDGWITTRRPGSGDTDNFEFDIPAGTVRELLKVARSHKLMSNVSAVSGVVLTVTATGAADGRCAAVALDIEGIDGLAHITVDQTTDDPFPMWRPLLRGADNGDGEYAAVDLSVLKSTSKNLVAHIGTAASPSRPTRLGAKPGSGLCLAGLAMPIRSDLGPWPSVARFAATTSTPAEKLRVGDWVTVTSLEHAWAVTGEQAEELAQHGVSSLRVTGVGDAGDICLGLLGIVHLPDDARVDIERR